MRILLAIDGSGHSHKAVDHLLAHPELLGGRTEITCVFVETPPPLRMVGALGADPGMPSVPRSTRRPSSRRCWRSCARRGSRSSWWCAKAIRGWRSRSSHAIAAAN